MIKWLFRISVISMLVLSGMALVLGIILFQQRETLKGRTHRLEISAKQVASFIETGDDTGNTIAIPDDQLKTFKQKPGGPPPMDIPLNQLVTAAKYQLDRLNTMRSELTETKDTLLKTEENLKAKTEKLDSIEKKVAEVDEMVSASEALIREKEVAIQNLAREKSESEDRATTMQNQIEDLEIVKRDLNDKLAEVTGKVDLLEERVHPELARAKLKKGQQGIILYVNPEWNFVVFGISPESRKDILPDLELLVHRGDRFVGKVRVASVMDIMAIADIMNDWEQLPIKKNDDVIY